MFQFQRLHFKQVPPSCLLSLSASIGPNDNECDRFTGCRPRSSQQASRKQSLWQQPMCWVFLLEEIERGRECRHLIEIKSQNIDFNAWPYFHRTTSGERVGFCWFSTFGSVGVASRWNRPQQLFNRGMKRNVQQRIASQNNTESLFSKTIKSINMIKLLRLLSFFAAYYQADGWWVHGSRVGGALGCCRQCVCQGAHMGGSSICCLNFTVQTAAAFR